MSFIKGKLETDREVVVKVHSSGKRVPCGDRRMTMKEFSELIDRIKKVKHD